MLSEPSEPADQRAGQTPKGRPTPSRKAAEEARRKARSASADPRERRRQEKVDRRRSYNEGRAAMLSGDASKMPAQHRGPVKEYIRDYVDSRWRLSEFALPSVILLLVLNAVHSYEVTLAFYALWVVLVIGIAIDWTMMLRGVRRGLRERLPDEPLYGFRLYALGRAIQIRRLRMPKPRIRRGEPF